MSRKFSAAQRERLARTNPLGRMGRVGEVTRVVRFLADLGQTFINGAVIPVNGGSYMPS